MKHSKSFDGLTSIEKKNNWFSFGKKEEKSSPKMRSNTITTNNNNASRDDDELDSSFYSSPLQPKRNHNTNEIFGSNQKKKYNNHNSDLVNESNQKQKMNSNEKWQQEIDSMKKQSKTISNLDKNQWKFELQNSAR